MIKVMIPASIETEVERDPPSNRGLGHTTELTTVVAGRACQSHVALVIDRRHGFDQVEVLERMLGNNNIANGEARDEGSERRQEYKITVDKFRFHARSAHPPATAPTQEPQATSPAIVGWLRCGRSADSPRLPQSLVRFAAAAPLTHHACRNRWFASLRHAPLTHHASRNRWFASLRPLCWLTTSPQSQH